MAEELLPPAGVIFHTSHGKYEPAGIGGEHLVYLDPYGEQLYHDTGDIRDRFVVKVNCVATRDGYGPDAIQPPLQALKADAANRNARYSRLRAVFGDDAVYQASTVRHEYLTASAVNAIWQGAAPPQSEGPTYVSATIQDYVPELADPASYTSLRAPYTERFREEIDPELYAKVGNRWLASSDPTPPTPQEVDEFLAVQRGDSLRALVGTAAHDTAIAIALGRFGKNAAQYSNATREILDLTGEGNVIITTDGRCKVIDGLFPRPLKLLDDLPVVLEKVAKFDGLNYRDYICLLNTLGYVRTVNFLSALGGGTEQLALALPPTLPPELWRRTYSLLRTFSTRSALLATTAVSGQTVG
ncbi:MAG TPA: hypothetical protein VLH86_00565 [Patescibacteria group bacterium]|nr:hypothetical protein [Patescibacteria group bacterium]